MPELPETMYCSEQITIPPAFPYLLRQYAKAAIRSQPTDLLQWSTAYFRCLSLNIPPPVKPRLEYPIPREHCGITPGWLKALLYQLSSNQFIHFKILWDRWTGACLSHSTLIRMLCLGKFTNPKAIPWLRFIALCAGHLTDDLTGTMKLLCEIISEEPEGGSAMIPYDTFMDLYVFLAKIDASKSQYLKNVHFSDSILSLYIGVSEKDIDKMERMKEEGAEGYEESEGRSESVKTESLELEKEGSKADISCPSITEDDHYSIDYYIEHVMDVEVEEESQLSIPTYLARVMEGEGEEAKEFEEGYPVSEGVEEGEYPAGEKPPYESVDTIIDEPRRKLVPADFDNEKNLMEDLERLKALQQEIPGEEDEELEKYKCRLIAEMPLTDSQQMAIETFKDKADKEADEASLEEGEAEKSEEKVAAAKVEATVLLPEEIFVDKIPGIGPIVPDALIKAVETYMKNVAIIQHNMVMPRNIRHYSCPPLETVET